MNPEERDLIRTLDSERCATTACFPVADLMRTLSIALMLSLPAAALAAESSVPQKADASTAPVKNRAADGPVVTERYEYYEVCGCCEKDLQCEMSDKAVGWKDGNKYDSITKWKVKWDYKYSSDDHACFADSFRLNMEIIFHLPKWVCSGHAPRSLAERWENYIRNLTVHEKGHRDKALKAAEEITKTVAEMTPASSRAELDRKVQRLCRDRLQQLDEEQAEYDASTDHGQVTGIAFP